MIWHNSPSERRHMILRAPSNCNPFLPLCNTNKSLCNLLWSAEHLFTSEWRPLNEMETLSIINQCGSGFTDTWSKWDNLRCESSKLKGKKHTRTKAPTHHNCDESSSGLHSKQEIHICRTHCYSYLCGCCFYNKLFSVCFVTLERSLPAVLKQEGFKRWVRKLCGFLHFYRLSTLAATNFVYTHLRTHASNKPHKSA